MDLNEVETVSVRCNPTIIYLHCRRELRFRSYQQPIMESLTLSRDKELDEVIDNAYALDSRFLHPNRNLSDRQRVGSGNVTDNDCCINSRRNLK